MNNTTCSRFALTLTFNSQDHFLTMFTPMTEQAPGKASPVCNQKRPGPSQTHSKKVERNSSQAGSVSDRRPMGELCH